MQAAHDYITQGLDVGKHQCALIVYGDRLTVQREYFGAVNQAMRLNPDVKEISHGAVIHEDEDVAIDYDKFGRLSITHKPDFKCWNKPIVGAYAIVTYYDGSTYAELMTDDAAIIDDIDARQTLDFESIDITAVEEYSEPEDRAEQIDSPVEPEEETASAEEVCADTESEDYCITVPYAKYKDEYAGCATGNYVRSTKTIEVYPNRKKGGKE